ncbi:NUDIX domain-containing protein [Escherichia coli]|nr:NUDIX domain-containing protein [Escherichia coli]
MIEVVAAIIERDGKILLAQRPAQSDQAGLWEFAGGKVEPDESQRQALGAWLLQEELGIEATVRVSMLPAIGGKFRAGLSIFMPGTYPTSTGRYRHASTLSCAGAWCSPEEALAISSIWPLLLTFHY